MFSSFTGSEKLYYLLNIGFMELFGCQQEEEE